MRYRTAIALVLGVFNAGWLCWVFVTIFIRGEMIAWEPNRWICGFEIAYTLLMASLFIERLFNLRERK